MEDKHIAQYMGLIVVEGFVVEARKTRTEHVERKALKRIMKKVVRTKESLGLAGYTAEQKLLERHARVRLVLSNMPEGINIMDYLNAVQMMINVVRDNVFDKKERKAWTQLEGLVYDLFKILDPKFGTEDLKEANELGKRIAMAVLL